MGLFYTLASHSPSMYTGEPWVLLRLVFIECIHDIFYTFNTGKLVNYLAACLISLLPALPHGCTDVSVSGYKCTDGSKSNYHNIHPDLHCDGNNKKLCKLTLVTNHVTCLGSPSVKQSFYEWQDQAGKNHRVKYHHCLHKNIPYISQPPGGPFYVSCHDCRENILDKFAVLDLS